MYIITIHKVFDLDLHLGGSLSAVPASSVAYQTQTVSDLPLLNSIWVSRLSGDSGGGGGLPFFVCDVALTTQSSTDPKGLRPGNADAQLRFQSSFSSSMQLRIQRFP